MRELGLKHGESGQNPVHEQVLRSGSLSSFFPFILSLDYWAGMDSVPDSDCWVPPPPEPHSTVSLGCAPGVWAGSLLLKFPTSLSFTEQLERVGPRFCPYCLCDIGRSLRLSEPRRPLCPGFWGLCSCHPRGVGGAAGAPAWGQAASAVPAPGLLPSSGMETA